MIGSHKKVSGYNPIKISINVTVIRSLREILWKSAGCFHPGGDILNFLNGERPRGPKKFHRAGTELTLMRDYWGWEGRKQEINSNPWPNWQP